MSAFQTAWPVAAAFLGGTGATESIRWLRGRRGDNATAAASEASATLTEVDAASKINAMALGLLEPYTRELARLSGRVDTVEAELKETRHDLTVTREELAESRIEQGRIAGLFSQAITALRDFLDIAISRDIPTPNMSPELRAEIGVPSP